MEKHDVNCDYHHHHAEKKGLLSWKRYMFSILFIVLAMLVLRGFIAQQLLSRGNSYMTYKSYNDAERMFNKLILIDPNNVNAHLNLGMAYVQQRKYADAVPQFEFLSSFLPRWNKQSIYDYFSYHRFSLKMLATCYQMLDEPEKMNAALKELYRDYFD